MCRLFIGADPALWQPATRSVRIEGLATSVRLEAFFWEVLSDIAKRDGLTLGQILTRFITSRLRKVMIWKTFPPSSGSVVPGSSPCN